MYHVGYDQERHQAKRRKLIALLGGKCSKCESADDLEFDHVDPETKEFAICARMSLPMEELLREVAKCQLLCKPCHRKKSIAEGSQKTARHGTQYMYSDLGCRCRVCKNWRRDESRRRRSYARGIGRGDQSDSKPDGDGSIPSSPATQRASKRPCAEP